MTVTGIDFVALQVRDLERAAAFYEKHLGLVRNPAAPPHAVVFATEPIAFAVREPLPGVELPERPGAGVALWLKAGDAQRLHDDLQAAGVPIVTPPMDGPFGRTFSFEGPEGYVITIHDR
ncbi:VOC family protein [Nonomuraea rubra]|uniref:VOC family protein n=1 Tax=Nonomuraea rubra TaxID=46180 RepID=UPI0033EEF518